jgi:hypothetical protein
MKDLWRDLAEKLYGIVVVAAVNCVNEEVLCQDEFSVYDSPKIKCFPANSKVEGIDYQGEHNYNAISAFAVGQMENFVRVVNKENVDDFFKGNEDKLRLLLFTARKGTPPLYKALSKDFKGKLIFGVVRQSEESLVARYKVEKYPTLMVVTDPTNHIGISYEGVFKKDQITKFMREYAYAKPQRRVAGKESAAVQLTIERLRDKSCNGKDSFLCVLYIAHPDDNLKEVEEKMNGFTSHYTDDPVNFYYTPASDVNYNEVFDEIYGLPVIVIVKGKRKSYTRFDGDLNAGEKLTSFIDQTISGSTTFRKMKKELMIKGIGQGHADEL